jgi:hypothetical protein
MSRGGTALCLALVGCAAVTPPPTVSVCGTPSCEHTEPLPVFWSGESAPPYPVQELAEIEVNAAEVPSGGMGGPSREQLLAALAQKAKALGADGLTHVQVEEVDPFQQVDPVGTMTAITPPSHGMARGMAVRRLDRPASPPAPSSP